MMINDISSAPPLLRAAALYLSCTTSTAINKQTTDSHPCQRRVLPCGPRAHKYGAGLTSAEGGGSDSRCQQSGRLLNAPLWHEDMLGQKKIKKTISLCVFY